jgi:hypothetical protein
MGWSGTKAEAEVIEEKTGQFLLEKLSLDMSPEKTFITHAREGKARFLNYNISVSWNDTAQTIVKGKKRRSVNGHIRLEVPNEDFQKRFVKIGGGRGCSKQAATGDWAIRRQANSWKGFGEERTNSLLGA